MILYHAFPSTFNTGYFGVDIFFVISGFVITPAIDQIIESRAKYKALKIFYIKRFWRLMPALVVTLILTTFVFTLLGGIGYLKNTFLQALSAYLLVGNASAYINLGNYFMPVQNPLVHTWSLSLEEQIYIFTPVALLICVRLKHNLKRIIFFLVLGIISLACSFLAIGPLREEFQFYSPHTRYWEFCVGAILYYVSQIEIPKFASKTRLLIGVKFESYHLLLTLISLLVLFGPNNFLYISIVLIAFQKKLLWEANTQNHRILKFLSHLGDISYSLYLVHYPIIWIFSHSPILENFNIEQKNTSMLLISLVVTYLTGLMLYKKIESVYRIADSGSTYRKQKFKKLQIVLILSCTFGIWMSSNNFYLKNTVLLKPMNQMDPTYNHNCEIIDGKDMCSFASSSDKKILIIGDSHAGSISKTLVSVAGAFGSVDVFLKSGCQYLSSGHYVKAPRSASEKTCFEYSKNVTNIVTKKKYDLIIASYRSATLNNSSYSAEEYSKMKIQSLLNLVRANNSELLFIGPVPEFPLNPDFFEPNRLLISGNEKPPKYFHKRDLNQIPFIENSFYIDYLDSFHKKVSYVDSIKLFCNSQSCIRWRNGWLYSDADHVSNLGAEFMRNEISDALMLLLT